MKLLILMTNFFVLERIARSIQKGLVFRPVLFVFGRCDLLDPLILCFIPTIRQNLAMSGTPVPGDSPCRFFKPAPRPPFQ